jgi:hypothetical protein
VNVMSMPTSPVVKNHNPAWQELARFLEGELLETRARLEIDGPAAARIRAASDHRQGRMIFVTPLRDTE